MLMQRKRIKGASALVFLCVCMKGCIHGTVWIEPDNIRVDAAHGGARFCRGRPVCTRGNVYKGGLRTKELGQDSVTEARKDVIRE